MTAISVNTILETYASLRQLFTWNIFILKFIILFNLCFNAEIATVLEKQKQSVIKLLHSEIEFKTLNIF